MSTPAKITCVGCNGSGTIHMDQFMDAQGWHPLGQAAFDVTCKRCGGTGLFWSSWECVIQGQVISWNEAYRVARKTGVAKNGRSYEHHGIFKTDEAAQFQLDCIRQIKPQVPSGWKPEGLFIRMTYGFYLVNDMDASNCLKLVEDAFAKAVGINDRWYLPCVEGKWIVKPNEARIEIDITVP